MMDEPGAGLSQTESVILRQVIVGIPDYCGAQVLLVDHDVDLISATCHETLWCSTSAARSPLAGLLTYSRIPRSAPPISAPWKKPHEQGVFP